MWGHTCRYDNNASDIVYKCCIQPVHSILSIQVRIIGKIYHRTNVTILILQHLSVDQKTTPWLDYREQVHQLIAMANLMICILDLGLSVALGMWKIPRRRRRHFESPTVHVLSISDLLYLMKQSLGIHQILTKLYSLPLSNCN